VEATITAINAKTKDQLTFKPVPRNGHYVMALTPGIYDITIDSQGLPSITDKIIIYDLSSFQPETIKDYSFVKQEEPKKEPPHENNKPAPPNRIH
jgi:hypothetical protein